MFTILIVIFTGCACKAAYRHDATMVVIWSLLTVICLGATLASMTAYNASHYGLIMGILSAPFIVWLRSPRSRQQH